MPNRVDDASLAEELWAGLRRVARTLVVPLIVALPPYLWVREAMRHAALETLGRDQGIFQYVAWAVRHGARDYGDVRDVNGPLTHLVHIVFQLLGGADEHRFRVLDLTITSVTYALAGACLPGLSRTRGDRAPGFTERAAWAFAGWVILGAQYMHYIFWDQAQRESFFDWFMVSSVAVQLYAESREPTRRTGLLLGLAGALSVIPWFGKPTYALFTFAQVATLLIDPDFALPRRARLSSYVAGAALGALTQLAYLFAFADVRAFLRIYFVDVPALYRFIWPRTPLDILSLSGYATTSALAIVTSVAMIGLIVDRQLPARTLGVALTPLAGLVSVVVQAKGFPYHFHPVSAGLYLEWLVIVVWLWERHGRGSREPDGPRGITELLPFAAAAALALAVATGVQLSSHLTNHWILTKGVTPELRASRDYFAYFRTVDYSPWELREAARYLRDHTGPDDRVQEYGMDPYLLFLAERRSATPYIYAYDLDVDAALYGSDVPEPEGLHPNAEEEWRIRMLRDAHEADFLARIEAAPPAAFVFMDRAPLITESDDAWLDFSEHNAKSAPFVLEHYKQTAIFGDARIWMRKDLALGLAEAAWVPAAARAPEAP
jgi:hypothetical protein